MVAVDLANASSAAAFRLSMDTLNGRATHQVVGGPAGVDESVYVDLRVRAGVRGIAPVVEGSASAGGLAISVLGVDPFAEAGFRDYQEAGNASDDGLARIRRLLTEPGAVLLAPGTGRRLGVEADGTLALDVDGRVVRARVAGSLAADERLQNLLIVDISTAQAWFDTPGRLSRIDVRAGPGAATAAQVRQELPAGLELIEADTRTAAMTEMTAAFMTNLSAMSLLAMLVGLFLIYNSVSFAVLQRRGLIGTLRALGLTRKEVLGLILGEALVLGVVGAATGVLIGLALGDQLVTLVARSINDLYFRVSVTGVALDPLAIGKGFLAGLAATLVASAAPAIEAANVVPSLAQKRSQVESQLRRAVPLLALAGILIALLSFGVIATSGQSLVAGLAALFGLIIGIALVVPLAVRLVVPPLAAFAGAVGGCLPRLAIKGIRDALSRTAVAVVALAVAVSATIGVSVMVDSFRLAVSDWLAGTLRADLYAGRERGDLEPGVAMEIEAIAGVADVSTSRRAWIESADGRTRVIALGMAGDSYAGTRLLDAEPGEVWPRFETESVVLVSETFAYRNGLATGDALRLRTETGYESFDIIATYLSYDANSGAVLMSRDSYLRHWSDRGIDALGIYLEAGADPAAVIERLKAVGQNGQPLRVSSNAALRTASLEVFDRTFVITNVLYWLATGVAMTGILGAMLALELERTRELGLLRALGVTPAQLGGIVSLQAATMGLLAGIAAVPLGLVMADVLIDVINRRSFGWRMDMHVTPSVLVVAVGLAVFSALIAGLYPAFRSGRVQPARAMREE